MFYTAAKFLWSMLLLGSLMAIMFSLPLWGISTDREVSSDIFPPSENEYALVFFGFSGCSDVCPVTLSIWSQLAQAESDTVQMPHMFYVDIDKTSSQKSAQRYAQTFHNDIRAFKPTEQQLYILRDEFGLNIRQRNEAILHQGRTYLLQWRNDAWFITKVFGPDALSIQTLKHALSN